MEASFGTDFSHVQAYFGPQAQKACARLGASAYAVGSQIAFRSPDPSVELVAHELTHERQQSSEVRMKQPGGAGESGVEAQADRAAAVVAAGGVVDVASLSGDAAGAPRYFLDDLTDWASEQVDDASDWVDDKVDSAKDAAGDAYDWASEQVDDATEWAEETYDDATEWAEETYDDATEWAEETYDDAAEWVEEKKQAANDWWQENSSKVTTGQTAAATGGTYNWFEDLIGPYGENDEQEAIRKMNEHLDAIDSATYKIDAAVKVVSGARGSFNTALDVLGYGADAEQFRASWSSASSISGAGSTIRSNALKAAGPPSEWGKTLGSGVKKYQTISKWVGVIEGTAGLITGACNVNTNFKDLDGAKAWGASVGKAFADAGKLVSAVPGFGSVFSPLFSVPAGAISGFSSMIDSRYRKIDGEWMRRCQAEAPPEGEESKCAG